MGFVLFLVATFLLAVGVRPRLGLPGGVGEQLGLTMLLWFAILIGTTWGLAIPRCLTANALWLCTVVYFLVAGGLLWTGRKAAKSFLSLASMTPLAVLTLSVLGAGILFIVVRGSLVPPLEFDALSYHFPKAVEIMRAHAVPFIPSGDFRISFFPWNYELLLADGLILTGGDQQSFWIGLLATMGLSSYACAILARAWPRSTATEVLLGLVMIAASPVLILHAGAYKNDILFAFFLLSAIHWLTLGSQGGGRKAWILAILSLSLGFGTKSTALFFLPVAGIIAWRSRPRSLSPGAWRWVLGTASLGLLLVLTGSAWPILNWIWSGHFLGETAQVGGISGFQANVVPHYTGFSNLWRFPLLAILRPFSSNELGVWVFWKHQYWYWPAYNCIYGHFGWLCSVLLLLLPFGVAQHRAKRNEGGEYRLTLTWITLAFIALSLPQSYRVDGMFCTFPRYVLCIPVLVALWILLPSLFWLRAKRQTFAIWGVGIGLVAYFLGQSILCFKNDTSKPMALLEERLAHPTFLPDMGVENALDRVAGPRDVIAFDSGYGAFVYPLYGVNYTRPLTYLPHRPGRIPIPSGTRWVVIDRKWNVGWSHPGSVDTSEFFLPIKRAPSREDMALVNQLNQDPAFVLVYNDSTDDQWVFESRQFIPG